MSMFCRQCEQTFRNQGCDKLGVCGKTPQVAALQDLLIHALEGVGFYGYQAKQLGLSTDAYDFFVMDAIFMTVTNVNFDAEVITQEIREAYKVREALKKDFLKGYQTAKGAAFNGAVPKAARWEPVDDDEALLTQACSVGIFTDPAINEDIRSLKEILLFGLKGMAAYAEHAARLGKTNEDVTVFIYKALAAMVDDSLGLEELPGLVLECGSANLKCLEALDGAHTTRYGHPEPTQVFLGYKKGPAVIVSGHDLYDLEDLLEQTKNKGINIYTHGEMLPALAYPGLKKYPHLAGNYGTAWQNQQREFDGIPAAILMTTNCIQEPSMTYKDRIFTTNAVGWPDVTHIGAQGGKKDFTPVIVKALELGGFPEDNIEKEITIGFAHNAVLSHAEAIVEAVKGGKIRHFFLIGGCDGARPGRNYFTKFAEELPQDCVILTLACGKNRINRLDLGEVAGFPRLLDCGQCNDAYSAVVIAQALANAFECGVNDLPLSLIISWYEQKAVAVLLTLLFLGFKNIKLGPTLPAFVSENVLNILVEKFQIQPIRTVEEDMGEILGGV